MWRAVSPFSLCPARAWLDMTEPTVRMIWMAVLLAPAFREWTVKMSWREILRLPLPDLPVDHVRLILLEMESLVQVNFQNIDMFILVFLYVKSF